MLIATVVADSVLCRPTVKHFDCLSNHEAIKREIARLYDNPTGYLRQLNALSQHDQS
jgi:hypothetical protein